MGLHGCGGGQKWGGRGTEGGRKRRESAGSVQGVLIPSAAAGPGGCSAPSPWGSGSRPSRTARAYKQKLASEPALQAVRGRPESRHGPRERREPELSALRSRPENRFAESDSDLSLARRAIAGDPSRR